ncbi:MAG: thymidine phosphorylase [Alphaproteobacteria bacterium]|nr:thymidine phosphorylase [Alphaproteobacteria bacterium]
MIQQWLEDKRLGRAHSAEDIAALIDGVLDGSVTRPQIAAWLAFVVCKGMSDAETVALTQAMTASGARFDWAGLEGPFVDKHSTGGVGDKVSLVLAPVWAAMGLKVPMISGRGLGITGGTLDKLESIDGLSTTLAEDALRAQLAEVGCFICGQTESLAPADRVLYALRDETGTVESIPLITASILSKKLAEGLDRLVLDVKVGSGAFMKTMSRARALADTLVAVGQGAGVETTAHITDMSRPLGRAVGNAVEVAESIDALKGGGPPDLRALVLKLSGEPARAAGALDSGAAFEVFERMVAAQGGRLDTPLLGEGCGEHVVTAGRYGKISRCDAREIGLAAFALGAGRSRSDDVVHPGVGVVLRAVPGDEVREGDPLASVFHDGGRGLASAVKHVRSAFNLLGE